MVYPWYSDWDLDFLEEFCDGTLPPSSWLYNDKGEYMEAYWNKNDAEEDRLLYEKAGQYVEVCDKPKTICDFQKWLIQCNEDA